MIHVELKELFKHLNTYSTRSIESAAGMTLARSHYEISLEHLFRQLMDDELSDISLILKYFEIDSLKFIALLDEYLSHVKKGNPGRPVFSMFLVELIQDAWLLSSITLKSSSIRSGSLLLALISRIGYYASNTHYGDLLANIQKDALISSFADIVSSSSEGDLADSLSGISENNSTLARQSGESAIARFCEDLTEKAASGKIDPVFGRDNEVRQMIDILARRRKNNPIIVGDPGVGKTAVVEGLALFISQGDVPDFLKNTRLLSLELGRLEAGASVKGEFENRLNGVISEIKASITPVILFIDEAHMLIGSGGAAGGSDAANLLKPALARGELRTIAATTWAEYKKYFEKDAALARRFQLIKLDEPSVADTTLILRGLKCYYEEVHNVTVRDDAIVAASEMAHRYITGRLLPDKAVDLLDTACARVRIGLDIKPAELEAMERKLLERKRECEALTRDRDAGFPVDSIRINTLLTESIVLEQKHAELKAHWARERDAAYRLLEARKNMELCQSDTVCRDAVGDEQGDKEKCDAEIALSIAELTELQGETPLIFTDVNPDTIAQVVSDWTGVPLGKVQRDSTNNILTLADKIKARILGQDEAVSEISEILKIAHSGVRDPRQPLGVFLLVGPSGVGKTETAVVVADQLFGGEQSLISINMSEYQEKHSVSRLVGSPPGYVGYGEGGILTEAVRKRPYSVILLDEVEKAHIDVVNLFYQVFDKGSLADGEGRIVDFSNTVIFLTSNLASNEITKFCATERPSAEVLVDKIRPQLSQHFKPALLARMTVVPYFTLPPKYLVGIVRLKLNILSDRVMNTMKVALHFSDDVIDEIANRCTNIETGARNVDFIIRKGLTPKISEILLNEIVGDEFMKSINVSLSEEYDWKITVSERHDDMSQEVTA